MSIGMAAEKGLSSFADIQEARRRILTEMPDFDNLECILWSLLLAGYKTPCKI